MTEKSGLWLVCGAARENTRPVEYPNKKRVILGVSAAVYPTPATVMLEHILPGGQIGTM